MEWSVLDAWALIWPNAWVMVAAGEITESTINELTDLLMPGDTVLDGGNANYKDSMRRSAALKVKGLSSIDVGTNGGI